MSEQLNNPTPEPTPAATPPQPAAEKTFTQADIDRIVAERLKRQKDQYADYDQLKTAAAELETLKAGQLSEAEKLTKRLEKAEEERAKALALYTEAQQRAVEVMVRSAVLSEASRLGFANPEDAYLLLAQKPTVGEDGQPVGVAEAVKALADQRPYLVRGTNQSTRIPASEPFNPSGPTGQQRESDEQRRARLFGGRRKPFDPEEAKSRGGGVIFPKGLPE